MIVKYVTKCDKNMIPVTEWLFNNSIAFWDYLNNIKWSLYLIVNKELKCLRIDLILPSKML